MAAERNEGLQLEVQGHHEQKRVCDSRAKYREGRRPRAVKVYTINLESRYLMVQGVPAIGVMKELVEQFALYGVIEEYNPLDGYPAEEFTDVYLIKFQKLQSARVAKRKMDEHSFFGGLLHVCYAPEFETVQETREKLRDRRIFVARSTSDKDRFVPEKKQDMSSYESKTPQSDFIPVPSSSCGTRSHLNDLIRFTSTYARANFRQGSTQDPCSVLEDTGTKPSQGNASQTDAACHTRGTPQNSRPSIPMQNQNTTSGGNFVRFTPRTTQLQERQRKREHNNALALCGSSPDTQDIVIGPQIPEIPKFDMDDTSLNISADIIRQKLKKVSGTPKLATVENTSNEAQSEAPKKQRRRI
ncbi:RNA-binding 48 [Pelobates cultripes]|uniref:RNA-binding protein 48 n=1 Tax=Pelobates cultripes TaxID=61616 RepID=A0AAD1W2S8_PELCU|nr:RNA-binding 48 [Pelobates cultripes]